MITYTRTIPKIISVLALLFNLFSYAQATPTLTWEHLDDFFIYQANINKTLEAHLVETGQENRTQSINLWLSIETPTDELFFLTTSEQTPFSLEPQPLKASVASTETSHTFQLPLDEFPQQLEGEYTLSAFYVYAPRWLFGSHHEYLY